MEQILLLFMLLGVAIGAEHDSQLSPAYWRTGRTGNGEKVYWPFEQAPRPTETRFRLPQPTPQGYVQQSLNPESQSLIIRRRPYKESNEYPIVLTQAQGELRQPDDSSPYPQYGYDKYGYRPTQIEYTRPPVQQKLPIALRPVITIGPQPKLAYGEPFIREPYVGGNRRQPYRPGFRPRPDSSREFGPFGNQGPYQSFPTYANGQSRVPVREYGPFGTGFGPSPYAPTYTGYVPSLKFSHQMNPGTGQYDVEYQTANGIYRKETGYIKRVSVYNPVLRRYEERQANVKTGTVSWTSPEGIPFSYSFIADEKGYRPTPLVQATAAEALALTKTGAYQTVIPYQ